MIYKGIMNEILKQRWLQVRVDAEWLEQIDRWRRDKAHREDKDISRSEAVRMLVAEGIK